MKNNRRDFLKSAGLTGLSLAGARLVRGFPAGPAGGPFSKDTVFAKSGVNMIQEDEDISVIGPYGRWAASLIEKDLPSLSFRRKEWRDLTTWHGAADRRVRERLAIPDIGGRPEVRVRKQLTYDGLHIEELSWQLPYGRPTEAILLKPADAQGPLPGILAFHDHGAVKYFGTRKITRTGEDQHPMMRQHQKDYYSGRAWANEIAKRGYVVLVPDAFPFASRRVMMRDVPGHLRNGLTDDDPENPKNIEAYNTWAAAHESIMAKSLFCGGTTWPGVFFAEDRIALDILSARPDVIKDRIGCGGLSGGGMRTVFAAGLDDRIKCAVPVGFMTTWKDFCVYKSYTHTWMIYVPVLPNELDFPEILGLRVPRPTLVLNNTDDELFTLAEMKAADGILSGIYAKAGPSDKYKCSFHPGPHKFDAAMQDEAFAWFDRWLK